VPFFIEPLFFGICWFNDRDGEHVSWDEARAWASALDLSPPKYADASLRTPPWAEESGIGTSAMGWSFGEGPSYDVKPLTSNLDREFQVGGWMGGWQSGYE
jgi:hypothetical protein